MSQEHKIFMNRAISLAKLGGDGVSPNPYVGCVIVNKGRIVGEGFHKEFGGPHAEVVALGRAGAKARGATAYINLEPCTHQGKTSPCVPRLIQSGLSRVFIGIKDPNTRVQGRGIEQLRRAGMSVVTGLEAHKCRSLNKAFITWMVKKRPYTILKMAMSADGKIATSKGASKWISSLESRKYVHTLRRKADAVLVGANTALMDNPTLTTHGHGRNPLRIILDPTLKTSLHTRLITQPDAPTMVITSDRVARSQLYQFINKGIMILTAKLIRGKLDLRNCLNKLTKMDVSQLLIEGGGETAWYFIKTGLVDEILFFISPFIIGGRDAKTAIEGTGVPAISKKIRLKSFSISGFGRDYIMKGVLN